MDISASFGLPDLKTVAGPSWSICFVERATPHSRRCSSPFGRWPQAPSVPDDGHYCLGAVGHPQGFKDRGHVVFYRRFGHVEHATDRLVALPLHHESENIGLTLCQTRISRRDARLVGRELLWCGRRQFLMHKNFGWNIDPAGEHQLQAAQHNTTLSGLWNEADRAEIECPHDIVAIVGGRQHDNRNRGVEPAQVSEDAEAVAIRQIQIEENELKVGVLLCQPHGLTTVRGFKDGSVEPQSLHKALQSLANKAMVIDQKDLHAMPLFLFIILYFK